MKASILKWIAIVSMIVDHIGILLYRNGMPVEGYYIMRGIGRLAFPIFVFLLVEGFVYTKSLGKYILRMFIFAVITEPLYDLFRYSEVLSYGSNILFTFSLTLVVLYLLKKSEGRMGVRIGAIAFLLFSVAVAYLFRFEYSWKCILIAVILYVFRYNKALKLVSMALVLFADSSTVGLCSLLALVPIALYNEEKGSFPKWVGYVFYPLHLLVLVIIGGVINV